MTVVVAEFAGIEPGKERPPLPPPSTLRPIASPDEFFSAFTSMRARERAQQEAWEREQREAPARRAAAIAQHLQEQRIADARGQVGRMRVILRSLDPPEGSRERLLVQALAATIDAFTNAEVASSERVQVSAVALPAQVQHHV
ncbi:hypothetical protein QTI17_01355 [Variovorax sp. J31P179]|uniref:hypothetical protein n=1 Tax=Variovorax sp. J31P179 TaxID=3053508 RepID=UPI0025777B57|nr:hypothetical protein [Variovorax sp. J31P179]MDM0079228.1 hypothetical protein [Variovorax sp. J31P179]